MEGPTSGRSPYSGAPGRRRVFGAFRYREYRLFWIGAAFSNLGIWALMAGRLWLMDELTESPLMLGVLTVSGTGPILLLSMWGGVVADRVDRLRLVTITRAMFSLLAFLTGTLVALEVIRPWHLIAISLATGVLLSFDIPSRQAIVPNLVPREDLLNAIVLYSFLFGGAAVIGPSFFAALVNLWGMEGLFFFVGVAYALTTATLLLMKPIPRPAGIRKVKLWSDLVAGISYIREHRAVLTLIVIGIVAGMFGSSFGTLMPVFARQVLKGGVDSYGFLLLSIGVGGLAGTIALAFFGTLKNSASIQLLTGVGFGLALAVFSRITWLPASVVAISLVGVCSTAFGTVNNTLLQSVVADEFRGRVMSIHQLGWGASAIGGLLMGSLAEWTDAPFALTLSGLVTAVATGALTLAVAQTIRGATEASERRLSSEGDGAGGD